MLSRSFGARLPVLIFFSVLLLVSGGAAAWMAWHEPGKSSSVKSSGSAALVPDPKFVAPAAPVLPVTLSAEGQRVAKDMLNAFRCMHSGNQRALPFTRLSSAGAEAQSAALRQALGVLPDGCYVNAVFPRLANPATPEATMAVLFDDLLKRPDAIKLRMLFLIAGIESHPMAAPAMGVLRTALNIDFQQDWPRWESALNEQLIRAQHGLRGMSCRNH